MQERPIPHTHQDVLTNVADRLADDLGQARRHVLHGEYTHEAGVAHGISHAIAIIHDEMERYMRAQGEVIPHG